MGKRLVEKPVDRQSAIAELIETSGSSEYAVEGARPTQSWES